jgi:hemerythrin-like metal-binding protein
MATLAWDESFSVGINLIDAQHKKWFDIIKKLGDGIAENEQHADPLFLEDIIFELKTYVAFHFSEEEKYFERFGYEDAESHIKMHRAYAEKVNELHAGVLRGEDGMAEKLLEFVQGWAINHIKAADKLYSEALKGLN